MMEYELLTLLLIDVSQYPEMVDRGIWSNNTKSRFYQACSVLEADGLVRMGLEGMELTGSGNDLWSEIFRSVKDWKERNVGY